MNFILKLIYIFGIIILLPVTLILYVPFLIMSMIFGYVAGTLNECVKKFRGITDEDLANDIIARIREAENKNTTD